MINPQPVPVYRIRWLVKVTSMHILYSESNEILAQRTPQKEINWRPDVKLTAPPHPHTHFNKLE